MDALAGRHRPGRGHRSRLDRRPTARPGPWARRLRPWAQELTLTLLLYALWQFAGAWSIGRLSAAVGRGEAIWHLERSLRIPSERSTQQLVVHHPLLVHWLNEYYVQLHVPVLGACLLWLFIRHRDRYPEVRNVLVIVTGASLLIQLFPVAPPRLLPHVGIVDTGALVGPSDYAGGAPGIDQLSAMPSLHVAWALIVAGAVIWASRRRCRWLALLYPVATTAGRRRHRQPLLGRRRRCPRPVRPGPADRALGVGPAPAGPNRDCTNRQCSNRHIAVRYTRSVPPPARNPFHYGTPVKAISSPAARRNWPPS